MTKNVRRMQILTNIGKGKQSKHSLYFQYKESAAGLYKVLGVGWVPP